MYLRLVRLRVREGAESRFNEFYRTRVIPVLEATAGCRFAGLLAPWRGGDAYRSLTIWDSAAAASAYEERGRYAALLREAEPMLSARTEWRFQLGRDPLATLDPAARVIPSEGYVVEAETSAEGVPESDRALFVRILSVRVDLDRAKEFVELYARHAVPALERQPGCRGVLLAEGAEHPDGILSISLWEREEDAARYEASGEPERITAELKATFSPLYDWSLTLVDGRDLRDAAPRVATYQLVQARKLES